MFAYKTRRLGRILSEIDTYLKVHGLVCVLALWEHVEYKGTVLIFLIDLVPSESTNSELERCELLHCILHLAVPLLYSLILVWSVLDAGCVAYTARETRVSETW